MKCPHEQTQSSSGVFLALTAGLLLVFVGTARCGRTVGPVHTPDSTLRVGVGGLPSEAPERGVEEVVTNLSAETLLRVDRDGRARPSLAEAWELSRDGTRVTIHLRQKVTFHDGVVVDATAVVKILQASLPGLIGTLSGDIESIAAIGEREVEIRFRRPSPFVIEALDVPIQEPEAHSIGTSPFMPVQRSAPASQSMEMKAYSGYYLGPSNIDRIEIKPYLNQRAAWADMLRSSLDMLYEVGTDEVDLMSGSTSVALYTSDKPYQYLMIFNTHSPVVHSPEVRRALNQAIDRVAFVRDGLAGHGTPSDGPISPHHWAHSDAGSELGFNPGLASAALAKAKPSAERGSPRLSLKCLTLPGTPYERLALVVKQQLAAVGVDLSIDEASSLQITAGFGKQDFDVALLDVVSGWGVFRVYRWWHSKGTSNVGLKVGFSSAEVDKALDRVRQAANDDEYRAGVAAFQKAIADDPPAVFLAWSDRIRAVSRRFAVPGNPGRDTDVLRTLRLWKPSTDETYATRN